MTRITTVMPNEDGDNCRAVEVMETVEEVIDAVDEAMGDENLVRLHRASDGSLMGMDPWIVNLVEPSEMPVGLPSESLR